MCSWQLSYRSMIRFLSSFSSTFLPGCFVALRVVWWKLWPDSWRWIIIWRALSTSPLAIERQYLISADEASGYISCKRWKSSSRKSSQLESVDPLPSLVSDKCWMRLICPLASVHSFEEIEWVGWRPRSFSSGIKSVKLNVLQANDKISKKAARYITNLTRSLW